MTRFDRYLIQKFLVTFLFMVALVALIVVVIDFAEKLDDFIEKDVPISIAITDYYFHFVPFLVNLLSPICIFLAVILFTSRLAQDSEIVAVLASGTSFYRLLLPYVAVGLLLTGAIFGLHAFIVPRAVQRFTDFEYQWLENKAIKDGRHIHRKLGPGTFAYMYHFNTRERIGYELNIDVQTGGTITKRLDAKRCIWQDSTKSWKLEEVVIRHINGADERLELRPYIYDTTFNLRPDDIWQPEGYAESLMFNELLATIARERERGSELVDDLILEKNERIAYPFAALILTVLGFALSTRKRRGGIALQLGLGLVLTFVYVALLSIAQNVLGDVFPIWIALWIPNLVFGGVTVLALRWAPK